METRLNDGTLAIIWRLLPTDREYLREGYEHLSEESRYHRFLSAVPHLTDRMLNRLVDDVDGVDHVALVLFVLPDGVNGIPAGIGRIVRYPDSPHQADAAVTILDEWQGRGGGSVILDELVRRRPAGVTQIVTDVAADNPVPIHLLRKVGDVSVVREAPGLLHVVADLPPLTTESEEPTGPSGEPEAAATGSGTDPRST